MALRDIAVRLYSTQSLRSASLTKNIKEAYKQNIAFRFSVLGMAATLLRSETLKELALSKFVAEADIKEQLKTQRAAESEDNRFKTYVLGSIKTLSNQVNLLTAVSEKNSALINMMMNDIGFFRGQAKINPLTMSGSLRAVKIPVKSKTVKGQLDLINEQIQKIKSLPIAEFDTKIDPRIIEQRTRRKQEKENVKKYIAATVAGVVGAMGLAAAAGGVGSTNARLLLGGAALAGTAGLMSQEAAQQAIKRLGIAALPILGTALKVTTVYSVAANIANRQMRRMEGKSGFMIGSEEDYLNTEKVGTPEYYVRQQEIQIRKNFNAILETPIKEIDNILTGIVGYMAVTGGAQFINWAGKNKYLNRFVAATPLKRFYPKLGTPAATTIPMGSAAAAQAAGGIGAATAAAGIGGAAVGGRVWTGKMWKTIPTPPTLPTPRPLGAAPRATRIKRYLPRSVMKVLAHFNHFVKKNRFMGYAKTAGLSVALLAPTIIDMYSAAEGYQNGTVTPEDYKTRMTQGWKTIIDVIGVTGVSSVIGGVVGGVPGFFVGVGAGALTTLLISDETESAAEKIFDLIHKGVIPTVADIPEFALTPTQIEQISVRTRAPKTSQKVLSEDDRFASELMRVSAEFQIDPADLLSVMYNETAGTLDPSIKNPTSTATGLIQFTEATAKTLGTSTAALSRMSRSEQMIYVEKYFKHHKLPIGSDVGTIYAYVYLPEIAKKGSNVLAVSGHKWYDMNKSLDANKDGVITIDDLSAVASGRMPETSPFSLLDSAAVAAKNELSDALKIIETLPAEQSAESADELMQITEDTMAARIESRTALIASSNIQTQMRALMKETISNREYLKQQVQRPVPLDQTAPA